MRAALSLWALPLLLGISALGLRAQPPAGSVAGTVTWPQTPVRDPSDEPDVGHLVAYLDGDLPAPPERVSEATRVRQQGRRFLPDFVALPRGGEIRFTNDEDEAINHNVFSRSPTWMMNLGLFGAGEERRRAFPQPGRVAVLCSIHRHMRMTVYVTPNAHLAEVRDGRFELAGVPAGAQVLRLWSSNPRLAPLVMDVTVRAGEQSRVSLELRSRARHP